MSFYRSDQRNATSVTAFGEPVAQQITPVIQEEGIYGITGREFESFTATSGNVATANSVMTVWTGTSAGGYGVLRTRKQLRYRPGQGALGRFTAGFSTPDANTTQRAGFISQEQSLVVGYNGTQFGILRQNGGKAEIYALEITNGATSGSGNITITLNGTAYTVAVTSGDANTAVSTKIAASTTFDAVWYAAQQDAHVRFACKTNGAKTGTYSFSGGATGVTATITQVQVGTADTNNWTYQADWNLDTLDGSGNHRNPSKMLLDPSKINVYQINYRWLGVGEIRYAIENQNTGDMTFFHHENYTNQHTTPHLDNPSMKLGYAAANISADGCANVSVYGASLMAAIEGPIITSGYTLGVSSGTKTNLTQDNYHHLLSIKNTLVFQNKYNLRTLRMKRLSIGFDGNSPAIIYLIFNGAMSTTRTWTSASLVNSSANYSTTDGTFTLANESPIAAFALPSNGNIDLDLDNLNIEIPPNNHVAVVIVSSQTITSVRAAATWAED